MHILHTKKIDISPAIIVAPLALQQLVIVVLLVNLSATSIVRVIGAFIRN
jgi:hypothetical protein